MIRSLRSELLKLRRPAVLLGGGTALAAFTALATILTFSTATVTGKPAQSSRYPTATFAELAGPNGLTRGFANAAGLVGILVFVLFLTNMTAEYGLGTIRVLLTRQPRRAQLLAGKLFALLAVTAAAMAAAEVFSAAVSLLAARARGISASHWFTLSALGHAAANYANALIAVALFGIVGLALAVLARSTALALSIGLAWLLPLENIVQNSWSGAVHWLPGLLFGAVARGGAAGVSYSAAIVLALAYGALAVAIATSSFIRRDVSI
jgi:ABC-2 type transport system permease protein